jgi:MarR family transcriptional regulator, organic hydroperoxide resistance regulator
MSGAFDKSVSTRLALVAKLHRARAAQLLGTIGLHPGQEVILKSLAEEDGRSMTDLALALLVRPPTVTKMVTRLAAQGLVERRGAAADARQALVFLTEQGRARTAEIDEQWKRLEKHTTQGLDDKDRKRLRKLLRRVAGNLAPHKDIADDDGEDESENSD